jgi:hypothetical protein
MSVFLNNPKQSSIPKCHRPRKRAIQYAGKIMIELERRGVLDAPPARGMTGEG